AVRIPPGADRHHVQLQVVAEDRRHGPGEAPGLPVLRPILPRARPPDGGTGALHYSRPGGLRQGGPLALPAIRDHVSDRWFHERRGLPGGHSVPPLSIPPSHPGGQGVESPPVLGVGVVHPPVGEPLYGPWTPDPRWRRWWVIRM